MYPSLPASALASSYEGAEGTSPSLVDHILPSVDINSNHRIATIIVPNKPNKALQRAARQQKERGDAQRYAFQIAKGNDANVNTFNGNNKVVFFANSVIPSNSQNPAPPANAPKRNLVQGLMRKFGCCF
jgi:hypothetical protein